MRVASFKRQQMAEKEQEKQEFKDHGRILQE